MKATQLLLALWVLAFGGRMFASDTARPNILFIYADDQSYKTVSCYTEAPDRVKTPNIDRLAAPTVRRPTSFPLTAG